MRGRCLWVARQWTRTPESHTQQAQVNPARPKGDPPEAPLLSPEAMQASENDREVSARPWGFVEPD